MATGEPVKDGVEITSEGPASLSLPKHILESFKTKPFLNLTTATIGKSRSFLDWYNGDASLKALEAKRPIDGDPQPEVLKQWQRLQGDLSFLLGDKRHCLKTAYEVKELKPESENLPRQTLAFPEGIQDMVQGVDDKLLRFLSEKGQFNDPRPSISSAKELLRKDSGHAQLSVQKEEKKVHFDEDQTISKATRKIALAVAQSWPGILNTSISQVTVNNSTVYTEGHKTNSQEKPRRD